MVRRPTFAVIDADAGMHHQWKVPGLAVKWLDWELRKSGAEIVEPDKADVVCVSLLSPQHSDNLLKALKRARVPVNKSKRRPRLVLGGAAALSPATFDSIIDVACVGEGRSFVRTMVGQGLEAAMELPNAWVPGEVREVIPDEEFPWDVPPIKTQDGVMHIFADRGCRKKCLFCQTGWSMTFRRQDPCKLKAQYQALKAKGYNRIVLVSNDPADYLDNIPSDTLSATYTQLRAILHNKLVMPRGLKSVRIGVEAPSARLRRLIGKPIETEDLLRVTARLMEQGIGVRWFMIAGLPGECDEDYDDIKRTLIEARHSLKKGILIVSWTAFCPDAAAPFCLAPLDDSYADRYKDLREWFYGGLGFTRRVQWYHPAQPAARMKEAIASMACSEEDIRRGWLDRDPPNWRIRYAYRNKAREAFDTFLKKSTCRTNNGV